MRKYNSLTETYNDTPTIQNLPKITKAIPPNPQSLSQPPITSNLPLTQIIPFHERSHIPHYTPYFRQIKNSRRHNIKKLNQLPKLFS